MANAGFNAATDIFNLGAAWKVKSNDLNATVNTAECPNYLGDITARDQYGEQIAPTAEYECASASATLPALGTVVDVDGKKVAISRIVVNTRVGSAPTVQVSGVQVESGAKTLRTYALPKLTFSTRHRAQDITGDLGTTVPATLTSGQFTFEANITRAEPKGEITASDVSNGRYEAQYTHTVGDGTAISAPNVTGAKVVSAPVSKSSPENDYTTYTYSVSGSLTGTETGGDS